MYNKYLGRVCVYNEDKSLTGLHETSVGKYLSVDAAWCPRKKFKLYKQEWITSTLAGGVFIMKIRALWDFTKRRSVSIYQSTLRGVPEKI